MKAVRTNVMLPSDLLKEIDRVAGARRRSAFLVEAAHERLARLRFDRAATRAFGAPRFQALYRAWLERGEPVLVATLSTTLADAIDHQTGQLDCHVLPHRYVHLFPLVGTA